MTTPDRSESSALEGEIINVGPTSGLQYRHLRPEWSGLLEDLERAAFPTSRHDDLYSDEEIAKLAIAFPEGCFVGFDGIDPVAMGLGLRTDFDFDHPQHTVHDIVGNGSPTGHDPDGAWYYGTSIAVRSTHRRRGIGRELYDLRKGVCIALNLAGIVAGGVMPGFADHKHLMTADEYIDAVIAGDLYDPTLSFQVENGFELRGALPNYLTNPKVDNYAALIVWENPNHIPMAR